MTTTPDDPTTAPPGRPPVVDLATKRFTHAAILARSPTVMSPAERTCA
jgi:hypothetical protein